MKPSVGTLHAVDDVGESSNYLEAITNSSTTNNTCSFDAPPDILPPVPPRITNPPRNSHITTSDNLIVIDTDDHIDAVTAARTKFSMTTPTSQTFVNNQMRFENNFIQNTNSFCLQKNHTTSRPISLIEPPSRSQNNKLNMTNELKSFEVPFFFQFAFCMLGVGSIKKLFSFTHFQKEMRIHF